MMTSASHAWVDREIQVTRRDGASQTATCIQTEVVHFDFSQVKPVPAGATLLDAFLDEFDKDPAISGLLPDARRQVNDDIRDAGGPEKLSSLRLEKGMSQKELADAIGCKQPMISLLESRRQKPNEDTLRSLAAALDVSFDRLMAALANG